MYRIISFIFLFLCLELTASAQKEWPLDSLTKYMEKCFDEKKYDSSLQYSLRIIAQVKRSSSPGETDLFAAQAALLNAGKCYKEKGDLVHAQQYLMFSLRESRALQSGSAISNSLVELNLLHEMISKKNLVFPYHAPEITEEVNMYFPISKVEIVSADSIRITIRAGYYDGMQDSVIKAPVLSLYQEKERPFGLVNAYIRQIGNNYSTAMARNDTSLKVLVGDLVQLRVRVPMDWRKLDVYNPMLLNIGFGSNYKQPIFNSRMLYYFNDSLMNRDINEAIRLQVNEIVSLLGEDTATDKDLKQISPKGIFAGDNVIRGMSKVNEAYIRLFINFVNNYPRKYLGNSYKFSEIYATWVLNSTPLAMADVRQYLLGFVDKPDIKQKILNQVEDINRDRLLNSWFNQGMQMANADNLDSAAHIALLIKSASEALHDSLNAAWASYLQAYVEKKLGNYNSAKELFKLAATGFEMVRDPEGRSWTENALKNLEKGRKIELSVQTGHLFPYLMTTSPNSKFVATAGNYDKLIKIWDLGLGKEVVSFSGHDDYITSIHYSPDGRYLVSASNDSSIRIWNAYDYSLVNTIHCRNVERSVIFTPDSRQLVAGGDDSLIKFIDPYTGRIIKSLKKHKGTVNGLAFLPGNDNYLYSCGSDSMIYKWDLETNDWDHWYKEKGKVWTVSVSPDGKYLSTVHSDTMVSVWNLQNGKRQFVLRPNYYIGGMEDVAYPAFTPDSKNLAFAISDDTLGIVEIATLKERVYAMKVPENMGMYDLAFTADGNFLITRINNGGPLRVINFSSWDMNRNPTINFKDLKSYYNMPSEVQFSPDDNQLYVVHSGVSSLDLRNGSTRFMYWGAWGYANGLFILNDGNTGLYTNTWQGALKFYDINAKQPYKQVSFPDSTEELGRFEISASNRYIFLGGKKNTVSAFEWPSCNAIFSGTYESGEEKGWRSMRYDSIHHRLFLVSLNRWIIVLDANNGKEIKRWQMEDPWSVEASPEFIYIMGANNSVSIYKAGDLGLVKVLTVHDNGKPCYASVMSPDYQTLLMQTGKEILALDTRSEKVLYHHLDHDYENGNMAISHNGKWLATGGFDSRVNLYDLRSGEKIITIYTPREKDFMMVDADGNYLAPKNTLEAIGFHYNNSSYGFEQFDSKYNRPDLVLARLGKADTSLLKNFYSAYLKRLKKLNINEKDLQGELHLPQVRLKDKFALKPATSLASYELNIECSDPKFTLRSVQVLVNNNPVFGSAGKEIPGGLHQYSLKTNLPLSMGNNLVKVYCTNQNGAVSLSETIEINSTNKASEPKTYFIGIAVSNYKDSLRNLQYAAKDVRDLASTFAQIYKTDLRVDTLIDKKATRENILALRNELMKTTVNDMVIISVNGHGLLSDSLDFYYATYDIDFRKPTQRGLKYEELEALLDGIPARKKLLLIDACHSGALDKEELMAMRNNKTTTVSSNKEGTVKAVGSRGGVTESLGGTVDASSSFQIMQQLFADLSSGNGAVVISAAGGLEYAYESGAWNNGVFTWCIRKGIAERKADTEGGNKDNRVDVAELKEYVSRKVNELTNGKQKPVSRRENMEFIWEIR